MQLQLLLLLAAMLCLVVMTMATTATITEEKDYPTTSISHSQVSGKKERASVETGVDVLCSIFIDTGPRWMLSKVIESSKMLPSGPKTAKNKLTEIKFTLYSSHVRQYKQNNAFPIL